MKFRVLLFILLIVVALGGLYFLFSPGIEKGPRLGALAPGFTLQNRQQQSIALSSFRGKAVLLNFWATWCGPCQQEMPSLEALYQRYHDRDFVVLGVSLDEEGWKAVEDFTQQVSVSFLIVLDQAQSVSDIYQVYKIPETYLINPQGKIVDKFVGPQNYDQEIFYQKIERVLPAGGGSKT